MISSLPEYITAASARGPASPHRKVTLFPSTLSNNTQLKTFSVITRWCPFRPKQIRYTSILTYDKSTILHTRP